MLYNTTISRHGGRLQGVPRRPRSARSTLVSDDFGFEPEVTAKVLRAAGVRLYEVPISYYGRTYDEGKKITWRDGFKAVVALVRFRFTR